MYYRILLISSILFTGCSSQGESKKARFDTTAVQKTAVPEKDTSELKHYSNQRFKEVSIASLGNGQFRIEGKAQIFEASFGWTIEDGHNELQSGYATADIGAPEWGNFSFTVNAIKKDKNTTLHIILFETSMKDGSRQHELTMPLH